GHLVGADELAEIVVQLAGHRAGGGRDHERRVRREMRQRGDRERPRNLVDRQAGRRVAERANEPGLIAQQWGERGQGHGREWNRCIATVIPDSRMVSTASAATWTDTSSTSRSRRGTRWSTWPAPCSLLGGLPTPMRTRR